MSLIFVSHVSDDATTALKIALGLEEAGYTAWCYELDQIPGVSYLLQIARAIDQSQAFLLLVSPRSIGSHHIVMEVTRAYEENKHFLPVLWDIEFTEFQNCLPEWKAAQDTVGAASSICIPAGGVAAILARLIDELGALDFLPKSKPDATRIDRIRKALGELQASSMREEKEKDRNSV